MFTLKTVVFKKEHQTDKDFVKIWLEGGMSFIINENEPILRKFKKGYIITMEVQGVSVSFAKPKEEHAKSIKSMLEWIKGLKGYINLKGVKIVAVETPALNAELDELPDVDDAYVPSSSNNTTHLRLVGNGSAVRV